MTQKDELSYPKVISDSERFVKENVPSSRLNKAGSPEDYFRHVFGVRKYALHLAEIYSADKRMVEAAALLHDIGANAGEIHAQESAKIAERFLSEFGFGLSKETKQKIIDCIRTHSMGSVTETIEQQIIQDADGLIFIEDSFKGYFEHKREKLLLVEARKVSIEKTKKRMNKIKTEEGIRLAKKFLETAINYLNAAK